jgi:hypothetical protein
MLCYHVEFHYAECRILFTIMLNVVMLSVVMLSVVMLSVIMLSVIILSVVMLSVGAPIFPRKGFCRFLFRADVINIFCCNFFAPQLTE